MSTKLMLSSIAGLSLIAMSTFGNAAEMNPLSPSYQKFSVVIAAPVAGDAARYSDKRNPLTPTFSRSGETGNWVATTLPADQLYRDLANSATSEFQTYLTNTFSH